MFLRSNVLPHFRKRPHILGTPTYANMVRRTRSSADADKPVRRVHRSVKVTKHSIIQNIPFHMLGIASYCAIVTLSLSRAVFTIFDFRKCRDLEIGSEVTQGH